MAVIILSKHVAIKHDVNNTSVLMLMVGIHNIIGLYIYTT